MSTFLIILRVALLGVAIFNLGWSFRGILRCGKGRSPIATFKAAVFWLSAGTVAFQAFALFSQPNETTKAASSLTLLIGLVTAASLSRQVKHFHKFLRLFANVDAALAIVDLSLVDRTAADIKASECRKLTARLMTDG